VDHRLPADGGFRRGRCWFDVFKVLVKIMFDIYLIYDKFSSNQQKGENIWA
jgi:hypothetical protein